MSITNFKKETNLDREINSVLMSMARLHPDSKEYTIMASNLERLFNAKSKEKDRSINPDTIAVVLGNLLGIALILGYERANVITSKALGFIIKGRV